MSFSLGDVLIAFKPDDRGVDPALQRSERKIQQWSKDVAPHTEPSITPDITPIAPQLQKAAALFGDFGAAVGRILEKTIGTFLGNYVFGTVGRIKNIVSSATIGMNRLLETTNQSFGILMGSMEQAGAHVADLFKIAEETPFETAPLIQASTVFQTFGGAVLNTKENIILFGDAAAATNAPIDNLAFWVGRLYSSVQNGTPFGEAAGRLQELSVISGETRAKMEELQKAGAKTSDVWKVLTDDMSRFSGAMKAQATTWEGLTSTISDTLNLVSARAFKPWFDLLKEGAFYLVQMLDSQAFGDAIDKITMLMEFLTQKIRQAVALIVPWFGALVGVVTPLTKALLELLEPVLRLEQVFTRTTGAVKQQTEAMREAEEKAAALEAAKRNLTAVEEQYRNELEQLNKALETNEKAQATINQDERIRQLNRIIQGSAAWTEAEHNVEAAVKAVAKAELERIHADGKLVTAQENVNAATETYAKVQADVNALIDGYRERLQPLHDELNKIHEAQKKQSLELQIRDLENFINGVVHLTQTQRDMQRSAKELEQQQVRVGMAATEVASMQQRVAQATEEVVKAEQRLQDIYNRYDERLNPLHEQLKQNRETQRAIQLKEQIAELEREIANPWATEEQKKRAELALEELRLIQKITETEEERNSEAEGAQEQIEAQEKLLSQAELDLQATEKRFALEREREAALAESHQSILARIQEEQDALDHVAAIEKARADLQILRLQQRIETEEKARDVAVHAAQSRIDAAEKGIQAAEAALKAEEERYRVVAEREERERQRLSELQGILDQENHAREQAMRKNLAVLELESISLKKQLEEQGKAREAALKTAQEQVSALSSKNNQALEQAMAEADRLRSNYDATLAKFEEMRAKGEAVGEALLAPFRLMREAWDALADSWVGKGLHAIWEYLRVNLFERDWSPVTTAIKSVTSAFLEWITDVATEAWTVLQEEGALGLLLLYAGRLKAVWDDHYPGLRDLMIKYGEIMGGWAKKAYDKAIPVIEEFTGEAIAWVKDQYEYWAENWKPWATALLSWLGDNIPTLIEKMLDVRNAVIGYILDKTPAFIDVMNEWSIIILDWLLKAVPILIQTMTKGTVDLINILGKYLPDIISALGDWALALLDWLVKATPLLLEELGKALGEILDAIGNALPGIIEALAEFGAAFVEWVIVAAPKLTKELLSLATDLRNWIWDRVPIIGEQLGEWAIAFIAWVGPTSADLLLALGEMLADVIAWIIRSAIKLDQESIAWGEALSDWVENVAKPATMASLGKFATKMGEWINGLTADIKREGSIGRAIWDSIIRPTDTLNETMKERSSKTFGDFRTNAEFALNLLLNYLSFNYGDTFKAMFGVEFPRNVDELKDRIRGMANAAETRLDEWLIYIQRTFGPIVKNLFGIDLPGSVSELRDRVGKFKDDAIAFLSSFWRYSDEIWGKALKQLLRGDLIGAWNSFSDGVKTTMSDSLEAIKNNLEPMKSRATELANNLKNGFNTAIGSVADWLRDKIWTPMSSWFTERQADMTSAWKTLGEKLKAGFEGVLGGTEQVKNWLRDKIWTPMSSWFTERQTDMFAAWKSLGEKLKSGFEDLFNTKDKVNTWLKDKIWTPVSGWFTERQTDMHNAWKSLGEKLKSGLEDLFNTKDKVNTWLKDKIWTPLSGWFTERQTDMFNAWKSLGEKLKSGFEDLFNTKDKVDRWLTDKIWNPLSGWFNGRKTAVEGKWREIGGGITEGLRSSMDNINEWLDQNIWQKLSTWFGWKKNDVNQAWDSIGREVTQGFYNGFTHTWDNVKTRVNEAFNSVVGSVTAIFNIRSPSGVMEDIAENVGGTFANKIRDMGPLMAQAMEDVAQLTIDPFDNLALPTLTVPPIDISNVTATLGGMLPQAGDTHQQTVTHNYQQTNYIAGSSQDALTGFAMMRALATARG